MPGQWAGQLSVNKKAKPVFGGEVRDSNLQRVGQPTDQVFCRPQGRQE